MIDATNRSDRRVFSPSSAANGSCDLLERSATRGRERVEDWFQLWRKFIRNWLRDHASVPAAEADDLAQEVFLRLLRYSDDVVVNNPTRYLLRIARNVAYEWRSRSRIRCAHDDTWLDTLLVEPEEEPENALAQARATEYIQAVVDRLPARQREILLLHFEDGLTYHEIARLRGLTYRVVVRDLTRAYSTLRSALRADNL